MPSVMDVLQRFRGWAKPLLLDSALLMQNCGRYAFFMADPYATCVVNRVSFGSDPLLQLRQFMADLTAVTIPELPPFQGGAAGMLGYETGLAWENVTRPTFDPFGLPDVAVGLYDWVIAWDFVQQKCWLISQGFPETLPARRTQRARARADIVLQQLSEPVSPTVNKLETAGDSVRQPGSTAWLKSLHEVRPGVFSDFSRESYLAAANRVIEYIHAGDIFQANLSQRLFMRLHDDPLTVYARLRTGNAAPFAGYMAWDNWQLLSASPERFVSITGDHVETRPIKGTRRRRPGSPVDLLIADSLRESEKDQAENVMIVDLLRNDLSRVCNAGSLRVPALCALETYETVQHLVSVVTGQLDSDATVADVLRCTLPGGSISGAPKVRAMQIIRELESSVRGPYCGNLFYLGYDGRFDSSILIRTLIARDGWCSCGAGGGIVAQSNAESEYEETWDKAAAMLRAVQVTD